MKRINLCFYYQQIYRRTKNYRRKIHRRSISVGDSVGKLITDGICILRRRKNSVGKTVKSCSVWEAFEPWSHKFFIPPLNQSTSCVFFYHQQTLSKNIFIPILNYFPSKNYPRIYKLIGSTSKLNFLLVWFKSMDYFFTYL